MYLDSSIRQHTSAYVSIVQAYVSIRFLMRQRAHRPSHALYKLFKPVGGYWVCGAGVPGRTLHKFGQAHCAMGGAPGPQFTCFTSKKLQILTQKTLLQPIIDAWERAQQYRQEHSPTPSPACLLGKQGDTSGTEQGGQAVAEMDAMVSSAANQVCLIYY